MPVQKFAKDVAEAADNLKRGIDSLPKRSEDEPDIVTKMREGFEGVERSFVGLLERNGIVRQDPTGSGIRCQSAPGDGRTGKRQHPPGTVLQAWTQTWTLNGRLLRPAMVMVSKQR